MTDPFEFLVRGDVGAAVDAVVALDDERRRSFAAGLVAHVRRRRDNWWWNDEATALAVAVVGCLPTAATAADLLGRRNVSLRAADAGPVVQVARMRGVSWLAELAYRLADRPRRDDPTGDWDFVAELLRVEKAAAPTGDWFVEGWLARMAWPPEWQRPVPLVDRLRADVFLDALVPRLFEVDGAGARMAFDEFMTDEKLALPRALVLLAGEGRLDRTTLLAGCVSRLLRGDRPGALRPFVALHTLLEPTAAEVDRRRGDYLRLLADAPGPVASMAQKTLRARDGGEVEGLLDASRAVLVRPDRALVRAQLGWLDQLARRHPDRAAEIAEVLAVAVDHPAADVRDRAGALAARHGHVIAPVVVVGPMGDDLPPPAGPLPALPAIADPDELAEEVASLLGGPTTVSGLERVLDGVVRLAGADRARLKDALLPVLRRHRGGAEEHSWDPCCLCGLLGGVLLAAADPVEGGVRRGRWAAMLAALRRRTPGGYPRDARVPPPHRLLRARLAEIGERVGPPRHPGLLAAPTTANGAVDPEVLYERLARLGDRGAWEVDLTQALLRLPARVDEPLAARAAALGTPAGDRLAAWLRAGGLPTPGQRVVTLPRRERRPNYDWGYDELPRQRTHVQLDPPDGVDDPFGLLTVPAGSVDSYVGDAALLWPAVLPGYRGLVAAYALPDVASGADQDVSGGAAILPLLAECGGDGGPAVDLALAYGLGARQESDRVAAVDALLVLAAAGDLDAPAVGTHLGVLAAAGDLTLARVVQPLRDAAAAGAPLSTWRLLAAALPALLTAAKAPRGTPDLLTLAADTASATGVRIEVPGLADVAARGGSSRLVGEARRLTAALDGAGVPIG
ncbi:MULTISPECIES: DUF6493 family protein [unclassified Micromonospora]|uniref:DUF6493 family protein n=1 Tax=unclassified Micromonospora TaxID=2617518 RepID=UPI002FF017F2